MSVCLSFILCKQHNEKVYNAYNNICQEGESSPGRGLKII